MGFDDLKKKLASRGDGSNDDKVDGIARSILSTLISPVLVDLSDALTSSGVDNELVPYSIIENPVWGSGRHCSLKGQPAPASIRFQIPFKSGHPYWDGMTPIVFVQHGASFRVFAYDHNDGGDYVHIGDVNEATAAGQLESLLQQVVGHMIDYKPIRAQLIAAKIRREQ